MRTRTKIISSNTCRQFLVINQSGLVGTRRILCRHTLNKVSEGSNDWRRHNIVAISEIFYSSFVYTLLSIRSNLATKIGNNNLSDVFKDFKENTKSCNNIVCREDYMFKATFSKLVYLAIVDLRNGLLRIYALVNNLLDTNLVFSILLESLYLLPYTPYHFKLSKKEHTDISLSPILKKPSSSFLNRNQKKTNNNSMVNYNITTSHYLSNKHQFLCN
jgi:hypothetical protein